MSDFGKRLHAALLDEYRDCNDTDTPSEVLHRVLDAVRAANSAPALDEDDRTQPSQEGYAPSGAGVDEPDWVTAKRVLSGWKGIDSHRVQGHVFALGKHIDAQAARIKALEATQIIWHPMSTAPIKGVALFLVIPKTADETYTDTDGNAIVSTVGSFMVLGHYGQWSSLCKAIQWCPVPALSQRPPASGSERGLGEGKS